MRNINVGAVLAVRAIAGLHVVTLAWDFVAGEEAKRLNLLGFAIERTERAPRRGSDDYRALAAELAHRLPLSTVARAAA